MSHCFRGNAFPQSRESEDQSGREEEVGEEKGTSPWPLADPLTIWSWNLRPASCIDPSPRPPSPRVISIDPCLCRKEEAPFKTTGNEVQTER